MLRQELVYSGDDTAATAGMSKWMGDAGYFAVNLGSLAVGRMFASLLFGTLSATNFVKIGINVRSIDDSFKKRVCLWTELHIVLGCFLTTQDAHDEYKQDRNDR